VLTCHVYAVARNSNIDSIGRAGVPTLNFYWTRLLDTLKIKPDVFLFARRPLARRPLTQTARKGAVHGVRFTGYDHKKSA
jgi:hypothetical protein